jgi:hypothetical protein
MDQLVTGTYSNTDEANAAIDRLVGLGYPSNEISVIMNDERKAQYAGAHEHAPGESQGANVAKGAAGGGAIGGTLGAIIAGALATTGAVGATIATGGIAGPFVIGPLAAALAGAGAGAAAGSAIGAIVGAGASHDDKTRIEQDVNDGNIVVAVHATDANAAAVHDILRHTN